MRSIGKRIYGNNIAFFEECCGENYPIVIKSRRKKWGNLSVYFKYPEDIRRVIYTTNSIEAVHRQFRKLTKTKSGFPNENSLLKLLYRGIQKAIKKMNPADPELEYHVVATSHLLRGPA